MKIKLLKAQKKVHKDMGTSISLSGHSGYFTCSEDKTVYKWDIDGQCLGQVCSLDAIPTFIDWFPTQGTSVSDIFAISCSDGTIRIMNKSGREEIKIDAHKGSAIRVKWSIDGSSLVSCGEDGTVKAWSRAGIARSIISKTANPVYSLSWGPDDDQMVFCSGKDIIIRALQNAKKQFKWKAHDSVILSVDWNKINNRIVSGGEDCKYKIWDSYGRLLFSSAIIDNIINVVSWVKSGEYFMVGCFGYMRICDNNGLCLHKEPLKGGSPFDIAWAIDNTQIGIISGSGSLILGYLTGKTCFWKSITAELKEPREIQIIDTNTGNKEEIDYRDRVVNMTMKYNHLIVTTNTQCYIYTVNTQLIK